MTEAVADHCKRILTEYSLDAFVFLDLKNIRYCCGFTGTSGVYVFSPQKDLFLSDSRYKEQSRAQVSASQRICYQNKIETLIDVLKSEGFNRIGFEGDTVCVSQWEELTRRSEGSLEWVSVSDSIRSLRGVKSETEIDRLQQAADFNASAFAEIEHLIKPGVSEKEIALELEFALRRQGGEDRAFDFIVASGIRGAMPHGVASDKRLAAGELITIDFGTRVDGYHSDETVTLGIGQVEKDLLHIYDVVLEAQELALKAARPGVVLADLDAVARTHITDAGYGEYFGHGLGHGVGLDIHEYPTVSGRGLDPLQQGMVITIEPGIYVPGRGGVRLEDTVVITDTGCRALTKIPKKYRALM